LNGSIREASNVTQGTYNFKYTVTGFCNVVDFVTLQITINILPENIEISANDLICVGENIDLFTEFISNALYFWQGPNGFSSMLQNPIIENASASNGGEYIVRVKIEDCESEPVSLNVPGFYCFR
jgi:hypothetical protein